MPIATGHYEFYTTLTLYASCATLSPVSLRSVINPAFFLDPQNLMSGWFLFLKTYLYVHHVDLPINHHIVLTRRNNIVCTETLQKFCLRAVQSCWKIYIKKKNYTLDIGRKSLVTPLNMCYFICRIKFGYSVLLFFILLFFGSNFDVLILTTWSIYCYIFAPHSNISQNTLWTKIINILWLKNPVEGYIQLS